MCCFVQLEDSGDDLDEYYSYKIKILNGKRKKKPITRQMHKLKDRFVSVDDMKEKIENELKDISTSFDIGYYEGRNSTKRWVICQDDLEQMYSLNDRGSEIYLWCDLECVDVECPQPKKKKEASRREDKEEAVDRAFNKLKDMHLNKYTKPQLKLWARMITNDIHESYDQPPDVPMITGTKSKLQKKESLSEVVASAAVAFMKAVGPTQTASTPTPVPATPTIEEHAASGSSVSASRSPGKSADIRMKNLQQLGYLKQLYNDNVLTEAEFTEQKEIVLEALRTI